MERSLTQQPPPQVSRQGLAGPQVGLDPGLDIPTIASGRMLPPMLEAGALNNIQTALEQLPSGGTALERFNAAGAMKWLVAKYQKDQSIAAIQETLARLRTELVPDLVGVRFKGYVWDNDDGTTTNRAQVQYGVQIVEEDNHASVWVKWYEDHELEVEYPELKGSREFMRQHDTLEELGLWNLDPATESFEFALGADLGAPLPVNS